MGSPRAGEFRIKNIAHSPDGPDTPDDPVAAALWLVAHEPVETVSEPEETPEHEAHEETGAEVALDEGAEQPEPSAAAREFVSSEPGGGEPPVADEGGAGELGLSDGPETEILDADFYEPDAPAIEGADLGAEILDEGQGGAFIFGDNLPQMRTAAIGLVVQISLAKQDAIWAEAGAGPDEYSQLMSAVVRDTVDGTYRGDQATYDRFVALSTYDNAARRVQNAERERVTMLTTADRATIEAFDPQANWP
jgi:hypothetical protein